MTMEQLKQEQPDLFKQVMAAGRKEGAQEERNRILALEEMCPGESEEMLREAKFGERSMTAPEFAMELLKAQKKMAEEGKKKEQQQRQAFLENRAGETADMRRVEQIAAEEADPGEEGELEAYRGMALKNAKKLFGAKARIQG